MPIENPFRGRNSDMFPNYDDAEQTNKDEPDLRGMNPEFYNLGIEAPEQDFSTPRQQRKLRNPEFLQGQDDDEQPEKEKPAPLSPDQR